jgi:hypothetical protein
VRLRDVVSAEVVAGRDGTLRLYANALDGIAAYRSRDGLSFQRVRGRFPLGAHPTIVTLPGGALRMYYTTVPQYPIRPARVRSAVSRDGFVWSLENGNRYADVGFGVIDIVQLNDGSVRLYYNDRRLDGTSRIMSARSVKGISFHLEPGVRLPPPYVDPATARVGAGWVMVVSTIEHGRRQELFLAESDDGIAWRIEREPLLTDPDASLLDPALVALDDGRFRLYYTRSRGRVFELRSGVLSRD